MLVFAAGGNGIMVLAGAVAAAVPLGLAIWWQVRGRLAPSAQTYVGKPD